MRNRDDTGALRGVRVLLTGGTGLLGSRLLVELLERGASVTALARSRGRVTAAERVRSMLEAVAPGLDVSALRVLDAPPNRGLRATLAASPRPLHVVHAAAAVKFNASFDELVEQNFRATAELLDALDVHVPEAHFHFVSTAYVCGVHDGVFYESERRLPRRFRHGYEESKLLAEQLVHEHCSVSGRPFNVYRPSIIAGCSRTGVAANFNGIYGLLRAVDTLARGAFVPAGERVVIRCEPSATKNIVPVDWVARSLATLMGAARPGLTFHLSHPRPCRHSELAALLREVTGFEGLELSSAGAASGGRAQRLLDRWLAPFSPYLRGEPTFDRSELTAALGADAEPPVLDRDYFDRVLGFARSVRWAERPLETSFKTPLEPAARSACPQVPTHTADSARGASPERTAAW